MTREQYEYLSLQQLRDMAKDRKLRHISGLRKNELVDLMLAEDEKAKNREQESTQMENRASEESEEEAVQTEKQSRAENQGQQEGQSQEDKPAADFLICKQSKQCRFTSSRRTENKAVSYVSYIKI